MPFKKGQSGNPGGRRKLVDVRTMLEKHGPQAIRIIVDLAEHAADERVRYSAAQNLADRYYGKPGTSTEDASTTAERAELAGLVLEAKRLEVAKLRREVEQGAEGATREPIEIVVKTYTEEP